MKPPFRGQNIFSPIFLVVLFVLATLYFCLGCDNKQGVMIGGTPPGISGNDIHGEFVSLNQFKGKVVVLYFWTNSCCGDRLKLLEPFYSQNKDRGLAVLAVNVGDTKEIVESYAKTNGLTFTLQTDERAMTSRQYGVFGFPTIFILDRNGIIREKILGDIQIEKLQKLVVKQLNIQKVSGNYHGACLGTGRNIPARIRRSPGSLAGICPQDRPGTAYGTDRPLPVYRGQLYPAPEHDRSLHPVSGRSPVAGTFPHRRTGRTTNPSGKKPWPT